MKQVARVLGLLAVVATWACAAAKIESDGSGGSGPGPGGGGQGGGGGGNSSVTIDLDAAAASAPDLRKADSFPDTTGCHQDDAGNYICCPTPLSILSLGLPAKYGANSGSTDNTTAFQDFMNGNTNGTAKMQMIESFTDITSLDLSKYDVIILQALMNDVYNSTTWSYSSADVAALQDWVTNKGGAIIAMSGYSGQTTEVNPLNQLLAPFGISYDTDDIFVENDCPNPPSLCYCAYGSIPFDNWTSAVPEITQNVKKVGVFRGRSIKCTGSGCQVVAENNVDTSAQSSIVGVAKVVGNGRVFAWADEWVTYTSQWGLTPDPQYDNATTYQQCVGYTPMTSYNVPQFWYNVFRWSVPGNTCFTIIVPPTADPGQQIVY
jgi:hypothetical protein